MERGWTQCQKPQEKLRENKKLRKSNKLGNNNKPNLARETVRKNREQQNKKRILDKRIAQVVMNWAFSLSAQLVYSIEKR
jgi:hypothetical protein